MQRINFYLVKLLLVVSLAGNAQVKKIGIPELEYFDRREYNGGTQNWDISQAKSGLVYFANNDGVLEFDGLNWDLLISNERSSIVRSVKVLGNRIYMGSFNELGYYEYDSLQKLRFTSYANFPGLNEMGEFWEIHHWNNYIVFRSERGMCIFKDDELVNVIHSPSRFVSSFLVNGLLLVQDEKVGLMEVRGERVFPVSGGNEFTNSEIVSVLSLANDKIAIATMKKGLFVWDMQKVKKWKVKADSFLQQTNIFCGLKYLNDYLVFGTIQGGLVITSLNGEVVMQIDKDKGLKNNTVLSVCSDNEGNIWGGLDNGIVRVNFNSAVTFLQSYYNLGTGYCAENYRGDFYFGTNQALYTITEDKFHDPLKKRDDFIRVNGTDGQVWSLFKTDNALLCGHNIGAFEIIGNQARLLTPDEVNGVWNFREVIGNPNMIISGTYNGLCLFENRGGRWFFKNRIAGFDVSSRYIEWDKKGDMWISHGYQGVYRLQFDKDFSNVLKVDMFKNTVFADNTSGLVLSKVNGECLFSGKDGIYALSDESNDFVRDDSYDTYFEKGNFPNIIREDSYRNLWCFHDNSMGVLRYLEDGTYKKIEYPFISLERKLVSGFEYVSVLDGENALFGVEDGFAHYSSSDIKNYQQPFNVHIRSFREISDSVVYSLNNLQQDGNVQQVVPQFKFRNNSFEVSYTASFMEGSGVLYSTYLKGFDDSYTKWSVNRVRTFSNLYEGEYTIVVRAINKYGVEAMPMHFSFEVLPPWHRTLYAKIGYIVLILLVAFILFFIVNKRIELSKHKEKLKQKEQFKAKEEQLKSAALQSEKEMIKMRNDKLRSEMVFKEKELANSTINLIQKNELLSDIKTQLKKLIKIRDHNDMDRKLTSLIRKIDKDIDTENNWEVFEMHFGQVHEEFLKRLSELHPDLSQRERKLSAYVRMGMSSKEIASLMNITTRAVENNRYKLRQKLGIAQGENLSAYIGKL
ncbi:MULTISPECIES: helix-turn-helix and ligand-binding sensor domain-containing protein [unclassified Saccharicrinis]|uniref:helix-turn-helix and ligand-binding sensor domain-containing protein n=1 Tax=unclassified Saccharicrinis TaxID=2646859 RepID=UPI003D34E254